MPRFSLIVPTAGRTTEVAEFLASIVAQNRNDVELIVVDQNDDDRIVPLLRALPGSIAVIHLKQQKKSPPMARNSGLDAASGEIIAFPDDDCWYPVDLLNQIDNWFKANSQYAVLAVGAVDNDGVSSGNRWLQDACDISPLNALRTTFCSSLFISAVAAQPDGALRSEALGWRRNRFRFASARNGTSGAASTGNFISITQGAIC